LADLGRRYAAQGDALRKHGLDTWRRPPPTTLELVTVGKFLLDHPEQIEWPWDRYVLPIIKKWLGKTKEPKRRFRAKDVAKAVDLLDVAKTPDSQLWARKWIAEELDMTFGAVKKSHARFGKRDKLQ
jgi:hypothetical protein